MLDGDHAMKPINYLTSYCTANSCHQDISRYDIACVYHGIFVYREEIFHYHVAFSYLEM